MNFDPVIAEAARAESIHGPLPIDVEPSSALLSAAAHIEAVARYDPDGMPLSAEAILCEEVCELVRATTDAERISELVQIEAVCARWRAALAARSGGH
jgi:hypothetical protein